MKHILLIMYDIAPLSLIIPSEEVKDSNEWPFWCVKIMASFVSSSCRPHPCLCSYLHGWECGT